MSPGLERIAARDEAQANRHAIYLHVCSPALHKSVPPICGKSDGVHRCYRAPGHADGCWCYCGRELQPHGT